MQAFLRLAVISLCVAMVLAASPKRKAPGDQNLKPALRASLYSDSKFDNKTKARFDPTIDFEFGASTPDPDIKGKAYSIRWLGWMKIPDSADYDLGFELNGAVRLYVDEDLLIDFASNSGRRNTGKKIHLSEGLHALRVDYAKTGAGGCIHFKWNHTGKEKPANVPAENLLHEVSASE